MGIQQTVVNLNRKLKESEETSLILVKKMEIALLQLERAEKLLKGLENE